MCLVIITLVVFRIKHKKVHLDPPKFTSIISLSDRVSIVEEELYMREKFGINRVSDETLEKLKSKVKDQRVTMLGISMYDPLHSIAYQQVLRYTKSHSTHTDIVLQKLNMLYMNDK